MSDDKFKGDKGFAMSREMRESMRQVREQAGQRIVDAVFELVSALDEVHSVTPANLTIKVDQHMRDAIVAHLDVAKVCDGGKPYPILTICGIPFEVREQL